MIRVLVFTILILIQAVSYGKGVYHVSCESLENCPEFVGGLSFDGKSVCTGVLVREDLFATNLHCIPEDLRREEASCQGRISVFFPATRAMKEESLECDKVKYISPPLKDTPLTPDYAFIRLEKKSARMKAPINTSGFADGELVTIFKIDPQSDGTGVMKKVACSAVQKSLANPFFLGSKSPVVSLVPCPIVKGNSGSPLMSSDLEVKGLVNSVGTAADVNLKKAPFYQVGFGSNFACLNLPGVATASGLDAACTTATTQSLVKQASGDLVTQIIDPLMKDYNSDVSAQLQRIHEQSKFVIRWDIDQKDHTFDGSQAKVSEVSFKPSCVNIKKEKLRNKQGRLQSTEISYNLNYLEWAMELHLDDSGRPRAQLVASKATPTLSFSPAGLTAGDKVNFTFANHTYQIPFCEDTKQ